MILKTIAHKTDFTAQIIETNATFEKNFYWMLCVKQKIDLE